MTPQEESQLVSGGECFLHNHPEDRSPTHDTLERLQTLASMVTKSAAYTVAYGDDWVLVSATATMTLPAPKAQKEFIIVCIGAATTVTVAVPSSCTINGSSTITFNTQWSGKRIKPMSATAYLAF